MSGENQEGEIRKIFLGGIAIGIDKQQIGEDFSRFGEIEDIYMPTNRDTGKLRGFGFVTFKEAKSAHAACELHGTDYHGREISVNLARAREFPRGQPQNQQRSQPPPQDRYGYNDRGGPPPPRYDERPRYEAPPPRYDDRYDRGPPPRYEERYDRPPPRYDERERDYYYDRRGPPPGPSRYDDRGPPPPRYDERGGGGPPPRYDERPRYEERGGPPPPRYDERDPYYPPQQQQDPYAPGAEKPPPRYDDRFDQ